MKAETIGLAVALELPLIVCNIQRAGPSTGMPTKTEQADLLQVLYGRNGESPVAVIAPRSPSDCFDVAVEAARIAVTYHTPVVILSDGSIANGSEPWAIPDVSTTKGRGVSARILVGPVLASRRGTRPPAHSGAGQAGHRHDDRH